MSDIRKLIAAVEAGTFLMDVMLPEHEVTAYEAFSGSLDAAKALHEALLPGWMPQIIKTYDDSWMVNIKERGKQYMQDSTFAPTPARAWLLAILRAVEAKG